MADFGHLKEVSPHMHLGGARSKPAKPAKAETFGFGDEGDSVPNLAGGYSNNLVPTPAAPLRRVAGAAKPAAGGAKKETLDLDNLPAAATTAGAAKQGRRDIDSLSAEEGARFIRALQGLMKAKNGRLSEYARLAGYYGKPADGQPEGHFAHHGIESFATWQRYYLRDFESALQKVDREFDKSGALNKAYGPLYLPYWDWYGLIARHTKGGATPRQSVQFIPTLIEKHFPNWGRPTLPSGTWYSTADAQVSKPEGFAGLTAFDELGVKQFDLKMKTGTGASWNVLKKVKQNVDDAFAEMEHADLSFALETANNALHCFLGWPMRNMAQCAAHPIFWLHQCNVDRIYESLLHGSKVGASAQTRSKQLNTSMQQAQAERDAPKKMTTDMTQDLEFKQLISTSSADLVASSQATVWDDKGTARGFNAYKEWMTPFPSNTRDPGLSIQKTVSAKNSFHTGEFKAISHWAPYTYDALVETPSSAPEPAKPAAHNVVSGAPPVEPQMFALFKNFDPLQFVDFGVRAFVSVVKKGTASALPSTVEALVAKEGFASEFFVFGGRGAATPRDENLFKIPPVKVDLTGCLRKLRLQPVEVEVVVSFSKLPGDGAAASPLEQSAGSGTPLPSPIITSPLIERPPASHRGSFFRAIEERHLGKQDAITIANVKTIQGNLTQLGYYTGKVDGWFGPQLTASVMALQKDNAGANGQPIPPDGEIGPDVVAFLTSSMYNRRPHADERADAAPYKGKKGITFFVGKTPSYLDRAKVITEVADASKQWSAAVGIPITQAKTAKAADIHIGWGYPVDGSPTFTDSHGRELARSTTRAIELDKTLRWCLQTENMTAVAFRLYPVVLHELGHCLGLGTAAGIVQTVMSPTYRDDDSGRLLHSADIERVKAAYSGAAPAKPTAGAEATPGPSAAADVEPAEVEETQAEKDARTMSELKDLTNKIRTMDAN